MVHAARTILIQDLYPKRTPEGMEELIGAGLVHVFSDIKIEDNPALSVFVFDQKEALQS